MPDNTPQVAVVIPYFQREPGILRRAIESIDAQEFDGEIAVYVTDDQSPVPAKQDISGLPTSDRIRITVIEQANGGPAAARNTALKAIPELTRYVAFLDSDDQWTPEHLRNAILALEQGFDLYFSDHYQLDQDISAFNRARRIHVAEHPTLGEFAHLHAFQGNMVDQILTGNVIGTSTVVYRRAGFETLRFDEAYTNAGEDYLFWITLCMHEARVAFSEKSEARYGRGVNVYSRVEWGSEKHLERTRNELKYKLAARQLKAITPATREKINESIRNLKTDYSKSLLSYLKNKHRLPTTEIGKMIRLNATAAFWLPYFCARSLVTR